MDISISAYVVDDEEVYGDLCIIPHLRRHFRDSGLVMCVSTLPSPSLSVPCIWGILQSTCRKSTAFSAKDHFAKVLYDEMRETLSGALEHKTWK